MKILVKIKIALLFFCMIFMISCSYEKIEHEYPAVNKLSPGKKYKINLPENHSDGYLWHLSEKYDNSVITQLSSVWHGNSEGVDFNFNTLAAGQTTLTFHCKKYTDTIKVKHFVVEIAGK